MGYLGPSPSDEALKIGDDVILSSHINDGVIVNADINASAAIAMSKTTLVGGAGLTLSTNTLSVDADQSGQITSVGTLTAGTWNGTAIASAYLDADTAHLTTTQTFSGAKTFSADATFTGQVKIDTDQRYFTKWETTYGTDRDYWWRNDGGLLQLGEGAEGDAQVKYTFDTADKSIGIGNANSSSFYYKGLSIGDGGSGDTGITIYGSAWGALAFADGTSGDARYEGYIAYNQSSNQMLFATAHTTALTFGGDQSATFAGDVQISGTTPTLFIGDDGAEDTRLQFLGNALDIHIGVDDSEDKFTIGKGSTLGTTTFITIDENGLVTLPDNWLTVTGVITLAQGGSGTDNAIYHNSNNWMYVQGGTAGLGLKGKNSDDSCVYLNNASQNISLNTNNVNRLLVNNTTVTVASASNLIIDGGNLEQRANTGTGSFVRQVRHEMGAKSGDAYIYITTDNWRPVIYSIRLCGHNGNGHFEGSFYGYSGVLNHDVTIAETNGNVGSLSIVDYDASNEHRLKFNIPLTGDVTHPLLVAEFTTGGYGTAGISDISMDIS